MRCQRFHAGFSNVGYIYCDGDGAVLTWDTYSSAYLAIVDKHPWMLDDKERRAVQAALRPCPCGGTFLFENPPRCPHCRKEISTLIDDPIYFVVCGMRFDADADGLWMGRG